MIRRVSLVALFALAFPASAFARGTFDPSKEFELKPWLSIHLGPLDLSITKAVVYLLLGAAGTILFGLFFMRGRTLNRRNTAASSRYGSSANVLAM